MKAGDAVPDATLYTVHYSPELEDLSACGVTSKFSISEEWKGKKVVLFGVPGAFTPTCQASHLPGFADQYDQFKARGVDVIAIIASHDAYVMSAFVRNAHAAAKVVALGDPDAKWLTAAGLGQDLSAAGLGPTPRSKRFGAIIEDLKFTYLEVEPGKGVTVSGADAMLRQLA